MKYKVLMGLILAPMAAFSAKSNLIWGQLPQSISIDKPHLNYTYKALHSPMDHQRYQLQYKGIPIWGYEVRKHNNSQIAYTGMHIEGIERDVISVTASLKPEDALALIGFTASTKPKKLRLKKIIYVDGDTAKLAYHIRFHLIQNKQLHQPNYIIDANNGEVLRHFDATHSQRIGQGPGGNDAVLPFRRGSFQYGSSSRGEKALGRFDVTRLGEKCIVANQNIEVVNMKNRAFDDDHFPLSIDEEKQYPTFSFYCDQSTNYINHDDNGYAPINSGYSPINDTMFFAQATLDMYQQIYGDDFPIGHDLPIRFYTHIANLDNAFSMDTETEEGRLYSHQQVVIGNGEYYFYPMSQTTIPHEMSHNVTSNYSNLIYDRQSGGINESFSDMADVALRDYLMRLYSWYWDGKDWTIGHEESRDGKPLRYMEKPSLDGSSIDHAKDYYNRLNVHYSSGVFNRAFYLLAHQKGWSVQKAFQVMFDANRNYWMPNTNFDYAACGVIQAAKERAYGVQKVIASFKEVGVECPFKF